MDQTLSPEVITALLQAGGIPALILFGMYRMWNGTTRRVERIEADVKQTREAVIRIEARMYADDREP